MGIASVSHGDALALAGNSTEDAARVMRWILSIHGAILRAQLHASTHGHAPARLNREAKAQGQNVLYALPLDERVRWEGFPIEFLFWAAPLLCGFLLFSWVGLGAIWPIAASCRRSTSCPSC